MAGTLTQISSAAPAATTVSPVNDEITTHQVPVTGGSLYVTYIREKAQGGSGKIVAAAQSFVANAIMGGIKRNLPLTYARADSGAVLGTTASGGIMGISRTAGTSMTLVGEATSASAKTDKAYLEIAVPDSFVAGSALPVTVNANYTGSGTVTAASTTVALAAYTEAGGVESAIAGITAAQQITGTPTDYVFTIPAAAALVPGQRVLLEVTLVVTTSAGAATGQVNNMAVTA